MSNIIEIKIEKREAYKHFAHEKVYFFKKEHRDLIPKLFRYALVLPITDNFINKLKTVSVKFTNHHKFLRDDSEIKQPVETTPKFTDTINRIQWWNNFINEHDIKDRVAVVPILTLKTSKGTKPAFITMKKWFIKQGESYSKENKKKLKSNKIKKFTPAISENAYLSTPYREPLNIIQPVCSICPLAMKNLAGECTPGQAVCYEHLNFENINAGI